MRVVLVILSVLFVFTGFGQVEHELLKVSLKENSEYHSKNKTLGYRLLGAKARFASKMEDKEEVIEQITIREFVHDTMFIEVVTPANCCASFECELEVKDDKSLNLKFTKDDQDCFCLRGIYLTYKIQVDSRENNPILLNGKKLEYRTHDPNESRDVTEFYENGQIKSVKMYLGDELKRVSYFDEEGKRTKMIMYNNGKVIEKNF